MVESLDEWIIVVIQKIRITGMNQNAHHEQSCGWSERVHHQPPEQRAGLSIQSAQGGCLIAAVRSSLLLTAKATDPRNYQQVW